MAKDRANPFAPNSNKHSTINDNTQKSKETQEPATSSSNKKRVPPRVISAKSLQSSKSLVQDIPISRIKSPLWHDRKIYDQKAIESLAGNIQINGLLQPVIVREVEDDSVFQYERIAGFRRIEAHKLLKKESVPAVVFPASTSDADCILMMLSENIQRVDINPYDQTLGILEYLAKTENCSVDELKKLLYKIRNNDTGQTIRNKELFELKERMEIITMELGSISISSLINKMAMFKFSAPIIEAIREGGLTLALAKDINRIKDEDEVKRVVALSLAGEMSRKEIRALADSLKDSNGQVDNITTSKAISNAPDIKVKKNKDGSLAIRIGKDFSKEQLDKLRSLLSEFGVSKELL